MTYAIWRAQMLNRVLLSTPFYHNTQIAAVMFLGGHLGSGVSRGPGTLKDSEPEWDDATISSAGRHWLNIYNSAVPVSGPLAGPASSHTEKRWLGASVKFAKERRGNLLVRLIRLIPQLFFGPVAFHASSRLVCLWPYVPTNYGQLDAVKSSNAFPGGGIMILFKWRGTTIQTTSCKILILALFTLVVVVPLFLNGILLARESVEKETPILSSRIANETVNIKTARPKPRVMKTISATPVVAKINTNHSAETQFLRKIVRRINGREDVRNWDKFPGPLTDRTLIIVVQVHSRPYYFSQLVRSLAKADGIKDALLIISHDIHLEEMNKIVDAIEFCKVRDAVQGTWKHLSTLISFVFLVVRPEMCGCYFPTWQQINVLPNFQ